MMLSIKIVNIIQTLLIFILFVAVASGGGSNLKVGGTWRAASAEREPIRGSGGGAPSGVGEAERFQALYVERTGNIWPSTQLLKVLKYLPNIAQNQSRPRSTVHKTTHTHNVCVNVNRLNCRTCTASDVQNYTVRSHYLENSIFFSAWPVVLQLCS